MPVGLRVVRTADHWTSVLHQTCPLFEITPPALSRVLPRVLEKLLIVSFRAFFGIYPHMLITEKRPQDRPLRLRGLCPSMLPVFNRFETHLQHASQSILRQIHAQSLVPQCFGDGNTVDFDRWRIVPYGRYHQLAKGAHKRPLPPLILINPFVDGKFFRLSSAFLLD